ncbi:MAG: hypothetical protein M3448_04395 [Pseudomonadota bacterium]|jgi:hypothetical protein|nr:hypothetical protein [Pseudomonadota bacterium]
MMILAFLAAAATVQPDPQASAAVARARATVRIIQGVRISGDVPPAEALVRETKVRGADGTETRLRLIEFP